MADHDVLIVSFEGRVLQEHALRDGVTTIGRLPASTLVLSQPGVSRRHAEIRREPQGTVLIDVGSTEGTYVEGRRIPPQQPVALGNGSSFRIGPFTLTYRAASQVTPAPPEIDRAEEIVAEPVAADPHPATSPAPRAVALPPERESWPAEVPADALSQYLQHLPSLFHDNEFLGRFLLVFEAIWEPLERRQDHLPMYFDPRTCPPSLLPWVASVLGFRLPSTWPESRRRRILAEAMELSHWRGTTYGLARVIEVCTGLSPVISDESCPPFVFRITISIPPSSGIPRELVEHLVRLHKPAHAGYILEVRT